jgi:hypothetical protein
MLTIFIIISIVVACILSFLIVRVWTKPNVDNSTQNTIVSHPELGSIGPPGPNNGPSSGGQHAPGSNNSGGNSLKPPPGQQGNGNSEG